MDYEHMSKEELIERLRQLEAPGPSEKTGIRHRLAEAALRDSEERIRAIVNTAVEGIVTIDGKGIIESVNPAAKKMFGYTGGELLGKNISLLMPEPYRSRHDGYLANYLRSGEAKIIGLGREVPGLRKNGEVFPMDLSVGEVRLDGSRLFTGILRDITARKEAETRLAELAASLAGKNKELEAVVYVASHDLRSPLVNIQGFSQELSRACEAVRERIARTDAAEGGEELADLLNEDIPEAIGYILAGVKKMDALLSGFLRFSRLGRAALHIQRLDMNQMLEEIRRTLDFEIKSAGATLEIGDLPPCHGDSTQINQVFTNLLSNAIKYRHKDRPLAIRVHGESADGRSIYHVADNGIGIAEGHRRKIFEIFHRLNPDESEGDGLGLTIAQRVLERHQGRIHVAPAEPHGSNFTVELPNHPTPRREP